MATQHTPPLASTHSPTTTTTTRHKNLTKRLLAGAVAGALAKTATAPLDRVKILFQTAAPKYKHHAKEWGGAYNTIQQIVVKENEGIKGLYRGHTIMLARIIPYAAVQFASYEYYRESMHDRFNKPIRNLLAGSAAGATSVLATYPLDLLRTRMAYADTPGIRHQIKALRGYQDLYRGLGWTLAGIVPYAGVSFATYELLTPYCNGWAGMIAGTVAQTASYPLDVVRRRRQVKQGGFKAIWRESGWRGFYAGLSINYIKVAPTAGLSYLTYSYMKGILGIEKSSQSNL